MAEKYNETYIAFGIDSIDDADFADIGCDAGFKPTGGICAYPVIVEDGLKYATEYEKWCNEMMIDRGSLRHGIRFTLSGDARIKDITSWGDLINLIRDYTECITQGHSIVGIRMDYEKMSADYDAVRMTNKGMEKTEKTENRWIDVRKQHLKIPSKYADYEIAGEMEINAYGWVAECVCILNPRIIENAERMDNKAVYMLDESEMTDEILKEIGKADIPGIKAELDKYYGGEKPLEDLIEAAEKMAKNDRKFDRLIGRIKGLIGIREQMRDENINMDEIIDDTVKNLHRLIGKISSDAVEYDKFSGRIREALKEDIPVLSNRDDGGGMTMMMDVMADAMS